MADETTRTDATRPQATSQGSDTTGSRERYGPGEHYGSGSQQQGGQGASSGTLSQRSPRGGEGRAMMQPRGGMTPYGGYQSPFDLMQRMSEEMDRMLESFGFGPGLLGRQGGRSMTPFGSFGNAGGGGLAQLWSPRIEMFEREGRLVLEADLPGVRKEDLSVQIEDDAIVLQGQRRQENTTNERGVYHSERSYGSFHRVIPLPEGADADNARARFRDGVLEVEVPMQQRTRGRRLEIQDAQGGSSSGRTYEGGTQGAGGSTSSTGTGSGSTGGSAAGGSSAGGTASGVSGGGSTGGRAGSV